MLSRVEVHETVLRWHRENIERHRKIQAHDEEVARYERAISSYVEVHSD